MRQSMRVDFCCIIGMEGSSPEINQQCLGNHSGQLHVGSLLGKGRIKMSEREAEKGDPKAGKARNVSQGYGESRRQN